MPDPIITVYVTEGDDTTAEQIADVINGVTDSADFVGLTPDGTEIPVRFRISELD